MADFVKVMEKKNEMCESHNMCIGCPLSMTNNSRGLVCNYFMNKYPQKAEEIIMAWEKPIDWSNIEIDTPILVREGENHSWKNRYFAKYEDGKVFAWSDGKTSWSAYNKYDVTSWEYAKLAEVGEVE